MLSCGKFCFLEGNFPFAFCCLLLLSSSECLTYIQTLILSHEFYYQLVYFHRNLIGIILFAYFNLCRNKTFMILNSFILEFGISVHLRSPMPFNQVCIFSERSCTSLFGFLPNCLIVTSWLLLRMSFFPPIIFSNWSLLVWRNGMSLLWRNVIYFIYYFCIRLCYSLLRIFHRISIWISVTSKVILVTHTALLWSGLIIRFWVYLLPLVPLFPLCICII